MRLIDANRFRRFAHEQLDEFNVYSVDEIFEMIDEQPTVEAKPVVKGEWKYDWLGEYICSNCYERVVVKEVMDEPAWDWCPACGADMRKKVE